MKMMGIIFSNIFDAQLGALTQKRAMASLPFGGRYRLIDFVLTNMVSSGITAIGVITKSNYQSLMDHLGNGSEWDLDRKTDGLFILPPFSSGQTDIYKGKLEALDVTRNFLNRSTPDYVVLSDSNVIMRINYRDVLKKHIESGADITMITKDCTELKPNIIRNTVVRCNEEGRIKDVRIKPLSKDREGEKMGLGVYVMSKNLLLDIIEDSRTYNLVDFEAECLQKQKDFFNIKSYDFKGKAIIIDGIQTYYNGSMELLCEDTADELFIEHGPVYTKRRDEVPSKYAENAVIKNSLIADGCVIDGTVENSILFRGVHVKKGAHISDSIVMQDAIIGKNVIMKCAILDKDVSVSDNKMLVGDKDYPMIFNKGVSI